jgi:hypothetical protein
MHSQVRRAILRALWTQHAAPTRAEPDLSAFVVWLKTNRPDLLPTRKKGYDVCQHLKAELAGLYTRSAPKCD